MKKEIMTEIICILLILMFVYAAISKIMDFESFHQQLKVQPLPDWVSSSVAVILPTLELIAASLLIFPATRLIGLYFSVLLMLVFTAYVVLILSGAFGFIPCACVGVADSFNWYDQLIFNIFYALIALAGVIIRIRKRDALSA